MASPFSHMSEEEVFVFPVSFSQERLWFLDQFEPDSPFYNIPSMVGLPGPLNMEALHRSLNEIVRRHEVLRTTFAISNGRPVQIIAPSLTLDLPVLDLRRFTESQRQDEVSRVVDEEAKRPFDLSRGPLLRTILLRLADQDHALLLVMHHIISDGWSMGIFLRELSLLYEAACMRKPSPLEELPIQYADFAQWQREWLQGERLAEMLSYWNHQLKSAPAVLELPTDRPRPAVQTFKGVTRTFLLPMKLGQEMKEMSQHAGVTLFMSLLAACR